MPDINANFLTSPRFPEAVAYNPLGAPSQGNLLDFSPARFRAQERARLDQRYETYKRLLERPLSEVKDEELAVFGSRAEDLRGLATTRASMTVGDGLRLGSLDKSGEIGKAMAARPDLSLDDLTTQDSSGRRFLRPSARDSRRLEVLKLRPDLKPAELDDTVDPRKLRVLSKRPDVSPRQLENLHQQLFERMKPYLPPMVAGVVAQECMDRSCELMEQRNFQPDQFLSLYDSIHGALGAAGGQHTPFVFLQALDTLRERPDLKPEELGQVARTVGEVGQGARAGSIASALNRCLRSLKDPDRTPSQLLGLAAATTAVPDPDERMERLGRALLEIPPGGDPRQVEEARKRMPARPGLPGQSERPREAPRGRVPAVETRSDIVWIDRTPAARTTRE